MILVSEPTLGAVEAKALADVIASGWITTGERVRSLEQRFARLHGADDAVAVSSCTAGLHLSLLALGVGPGDEVLVPSMTFAATATTVLQVGAIPVFVDIEGVDRPLICPVDAARKVTRRTRAVVPVHFAGYPVEAEAWRRFAAAAGLYLIEDAAHAAGLPQVGRMGDAAAFSFYGNKNMTTAEGGMVLARSPAMLDAIRRLRAHGMVPGEVELPGCGHFAYDIVEPGFNYRLDEFRAAVGLVQLDRLVGWNNRRAELAALYRDHIAARCPHVGVPFTRHDTSAHHILPVLLPDGIDRSQVARRLAASGVQTTVHYPPVHLLSLYRRRYPDVSLPLTEAFARRELTLPLHPKLTNAQVEYVVERLAEALEMPGTASANVERLRRAGR